MVEHATDNSTLQQGVTRSDVSIDVAAILQRVNDASGVIGVVLALGAVVTFAQRKWPSWKKRLSDPSGSALEKIAERELKNRDDLKAKFQAGQRLWKEAQHAQLVTISDALHQYYLSKDAPSDTQVLKCIRASGEIRLPVVRFTEQVGTHAPLFAAAYGAPINPARVHEKRYPSLKKTLELGLNDYDHGTSYALRQLQVSPPLATFHETSFFEWRDRYGDLQEELFIKVPEILKGKGCAFERRNHYLPDLHAVKNLENRLCLGGVIVLTVVNTGQGAKIFVERRSQTVGHAQGMLTTLPMAFHDAFRNASKEYAMEQTIWREIAEELFGAEGPAPKRYDRVALMESCPAALALEQGTVQRSLQPTGFYFELVKGVYAFTYLLWIEDPTWWTTYRSSITMNDETAVHLLGLELGDVAGIQHLIESHDWTLDGYTAFILGLQKFCADVGPTLAEPLRSQAAAIIPSLPTFEWLSAQAIQSELTTMYGDEFLKARPGRR